MHKRDFNHDNENGLQLATISSMQSEVFQEKFSII